MSPAVAFLRDLQDTCGGQIPFERFMQAALYHPEFGYYTTSIRQVGRHGDFSTWPSMDASPARALASWLRAGRLRHTIEIGAGSGQLASSTLRHLGFLRRLRFHLHIVEISPILRKSQQQLLRPHRVTWHDSVTAALQATNGTADIYSNELIDAFPCRVFIRHLDTWKELALRIDDSTVQETTIDAELPESTALALPAPDGSRVEVHSAARQWLADWRPHWKAGRLLTIDYGGSAPSIYHRRPHGTLRAYAHQQRLTNVYSAFGKRDITADVNFDDVELWGRQLQLRTTFRGSFREFAAHQNLAIPPAYEPAADAFFVLEQEPDTSVRTNSLR
ncbi:MAG: SAM-dependent methyltransferase [Terrimicrobiaceae bacterium]|nr:SAM-dependent methyltransferase [Terrimicrobiaceae bacterium]